MVLQITLGTGLLLVNILVMAIASLILESAFRRFRPWLIAPPQRPKLLVMLVGVGIWVLAVITLGVWIWALGAFATIENAVYFSLVAFSTLGLGDAVPRLPGASWPRWPP
jgi:uncharacterized membrane protein YvlD (DUF360 family)